MIGLNSLYAMEFTVQSKVELLGSEGFPHIPIGDGFRLPPEEPSGLDLVVRNAVASYHLELTETLNDIVTRLPSATYDSAKFNAVCLKRTHPASHTVIIMANGDTCITGCTSAEDLDNAFRSLARELYPAVDADTIELLMMTVNVQNVVCTVSLERFLDLTAFAASYPGQATYDANAFPGVVFRIALPFEIARSNGMTKMAPSRAPLTMDQEAQGRGGASAEVEAEIARPVSALIFRSGKIIFTGGRTLIACYSALQVLTPLIAPFLM